MKVDEVYKDVAHTKYLATEKTKLAFKEFFPYVILLANIIVSVVARVFAVSASNPFTADFFIKLATNILSTMFCYLCFVPYGERLEKDAITAYPSNLERWSALSGKVRAGMNEKFTQYCRDCLEVEREEHRRAIIGNKTMISYEQYVNEYRGKSRAYIKNLRLTGKLTRVEERAINKANGKTHIKPINPVLILCGVARASVNDAGRQSVRYTTVAIISRPVMMFILSAGVSMINSRFIGVSDLSVIYEMLYTVLMIIIASVAGYSVGSTSAHREHDKIKSRIFFIEKFLEANE